MSATGRVAFARAASRRWVVLGAVAVVVVGAAVLDQEVGRSSLPGLTPVAATVAAPAGAESSSWYCTGETAPNNNSASSLVFLTNTSSRDAHGTLTVVNDSEAVASLSFTVPANAESVFNPSTLEHGAWLATDVELDAGGVVVTQGVAGSTGWTEAPCATVTSPVWYFAGGSTNATSVLSLSVFNPTNNPAVVDLSFVTPSGLNQPAPFQGLVVGPGQIYVVDVGAYVQNQSYASAIVKAESGRVVADELESYTNNGVTGLSLTLGSPSAQSGWILPRSFDVSGGDTSVDIFNPTNQSQTVSVRARLDSGALAPIVQSVGPQSVWALDTSQTSRIPGGVDFSLDVSASGAGVVVARTTQAKSGPVTPEWGVVGATGSATWAASDVVVLPPPTVGATAVVPGAAPNELALANPSATPLTATLSILTSSGERSLPGVGTIHLGPGGFLVLRDNVISRAGVSPLIVRASGPIVAEEDQAPAAMMGPVALSGVPLAG